MEEDSNVLVAWDVLFRRLASIAARLGADTSLQIYGQLSCEFLLLADSSFSSRSSKDDRRIQKLLRDVERVCMWPARGTDRHENLLAVTRAPSRRPYGAIEIKIRRGFEAFARESKVVHAQFIRLLQTFSTGKHATPESVESPSASQRPADLPAEYSPKDINELYSVLRAHLECTCSGRVAIKTQHLARLRLDSVFRPTENGAAEFDMLFSATPPPFSPSHTVHWQDVQLCVLRRTNKKRARIIDGFQTQESKAIKKYSDILSPGRFCEIIGKKFGSRLCMRIQDAELHAPSKFEPIQQRVQEVPSVSLASALKTHHLTNKMKVALANVLAMSVWQFYNTFWMNSKWNADQIHFMKEDKRGDATLYASKPYISAFLNEKEEIFGECTTEEGRIHRYPRLLSLGILLVEIAIGSSIKDKDQSSNINSDWSTAKYIIGEEKYWRAFDYPAYKKAATNCLDQELFAKAGLTTEQGPEERRLILYTQVVQPLKELLRCTGWADDLDKLDPMEPVSHTEHLPKLSENTPQISSKKDLQPSERKKAIQWLKRVTNFNSTLSDLQIAGVHKPAKIAIIDTGYDTEAAFFDTRSRSQRMKGWFDFVENSLEPKDADGHGTYVTTLAMKIAPFADLYVARIAKGTADLEEAHGNVAKAIQWATNLDVDIISMSFGFSKENEAIRAAIHDALGKKNILFFAAAANSGANAEEMFPASHDNVISIRGTNSNGSFLDFNPPRKQDGASVYGILGLDVPSASLSTSDSMEEIRSGTSVATPIAAGIAATVLEYANKHDIENDAMAVREKIRTQKGMISMFRKMSTNTGNGNLYLCPWNFFEKTESARWAMVVDAIFN